MWNIPAVLRGSSQSREGWSVSGSQGTEETTTDAGGSVPEIAEGNGINVFGVDSAIGQERSGGKVLKRTEAQRLHCVNGEEQFGRHVADEAENRGRDLCRSMGGARRRGSAAEQQRLRIDSLHIFMRCKRQKRGRTRGAQMTNDTLREKKKEGARLKDSIAAG
jgi:hypothetical protein